MVIHQAHFVAGDKRSDWERYATKNNQWAWDALRIQPGDKNYQGATYEETFAERNPTIGDYTGIAPYADLYLPTWHLTPFVPGKCGKQAATESVSCCQWQGCRSF